MTPTRRQSQTGKSQDADEPQEPVNPHDPAWQDDFRRRKRLARARIPQRFMDKTLATFNTRDKIRKELARAAEQYIGSFDMNRPVGGIKGLLMNGPVGCGKTHLAVAILQQIIAKGYSGMYYNSPDLLRDIRATFDGASEVTEDDLLEEVTSTDLLVFDDVGAERSSEFVLDRFYLIFNQRYEAGKPVIVTTNLGYLTKPGGGGDQADSGRGYDAGKAPAPDAKQTHQTMVDRLGERIVSRLMEMCNKFGPFPSEDWRMKNMR